MFEGVGQDANRSHLNPSRWAAGTLIALGMSCTPADAAPDALSVTVEVDRPFVVKGETTPVYVFIEVKAPEGTAVESERPPVNLGLVLDRSGSMADDGKIQFLRPAARMAVDRLSGRDVLSIVEYDDEITLMWPAQHVESTREVKRLIDALEPRGSTNLAGGLTRGIEAVRDFDARDKTMMSRVLLLSDGLANVGLIDPRAIGDLVRRAREQGMRVSALGLGRDYDEDLLQRIAEMGGGNYYYVEHPNQLTRVFERELNATFRTSFRDVRIEFNGTPRVKYAEIVGYDVSGEDLSLDWSDFYEGEERGLVVRFELAADAVGPMDLGTLQVHYTDVSGADPKVFEKPIAIDVTLDGDLAARSVNEKARAQAMLVEAERTQSAAVKAFEEGRLDEANAMLGRLASDLTSANATLSNQEVANKIEALRVEQEQMTTAAAAPSPEATQAYIKASKLRIFSGRDGKRALQMLQEGDKGYEVEVLQQALADAGVYTGPVDGVFDADVRAAVETYQHTQSLKVDGIAGPATMDRLGTY